MTQASPNPPVITFLSDYGHSDEFVGVCHGVIVRRCPTARIIDVTHSVPSHDVRAGAILLRTALPYLPSGVHLAIVDPGVSAVGPHARRSVALRTVEHGHLLVGPDNGLLMPAAERLAGVAEAVDIGESAECLQPISRTFHGRDIFAPVAAALAAGEPLSAVGESLEPGQLRRMGIPTAHIHDGALTAHVLRSDTFGNLILNAANEQLLEVGAHLGNTLSVVHEGTRHTAAYAATFADVTPGELLIYEDAQQMVSLAVNRGSAAKLLGADQDDELVIRPA
jgi:S-adenosyl-L-methionine hydrolase (adenosine-forming)